MSFELPDYHRPHPTRFICGCGKEIFYDISNGEYYHIGEKPKRSDKITIYKNEWKPGEEKPKVTYSENDPNASWNNPK